MAVKLKLKKCPELKKFTECELREIIANIEVCESHGCTPVYFNRFPPANHGLPWQETDDEGNNLGKIKYFKNGAWT